MALETQDANFPLAQGIDTKTDAKQVVQGKLISLQNASFTEVGALRKRNGYAPLSTSLVGGGSIANGVQLANFSSELDLLDGSHLYGYSPSAQAWVNKGALEVVNLSVSPVVRNNYQQVTPDSAYHASGLQAFVWEDQSGGVRYSVIDSNDNVMILNNALVQTAASTPKLLALGNYFVLAYVNTTSGNLCYRLIAISAPTVLGSEVVVATDMGSGTPIYDMEAIGSGIYFAYSINAASIGLIPLSSSFVLGTKVTVTGGNATAAITVFGDSSSNVWVCSSNGSSVYAFAYTAGLASVLFSSKVIEAVSARNVTAVVQSGVASIFYEVSGLIRQSTCTSAGVPGTPAAVIRQSGLASKAFVQNSVAHVMIASNSTLQASYFLINWSGAIIARLAPDLGGGFTKKSLLPRMNLTPTGFQTAYLLKDYVTAVNGSVYTQTGVQSAVFQFTGASAQAMTLGENLHLSGGMLSMYDGAQVVEHGFFIEPENLTASVTNSGGAIGSGISTSTINQVQYCGVFEWTDNQGQIHRSSPSVPVTVNLPRASFFHVTGRMEGSLGGQVLTLSSPATNPGIEPGMFVTVITESNAVVTVASVSSTAITFTNPINVPNYTAEVIVTYVPPIFGSGTGSINSNVISCGTASQFTVGQYLQELNAYFPSPTTITAIDTVANTITISSSMAIATGGSTSLNLYFFTVDVNSSSVVFPTLAHTAKSNVSLALYRTLNNQTIFFKVTSQTVPTYNNKLVDTVTIVDTLPDQVVQGNQQLYTTGGEVENDALPATNILTTFKNRGIAVPVEAPLTFWYAKQVIPGSPVEWSLEFVQNVDSRIESITAAGVMDDKLVLFGPNKPFYIVGDGPTPAGTQNDFSGAQIVASDVGCSNQASVVLMRDGLMFQSPKGIYLLNRSLQVSYVGADVEAYNGYTVTSAQLIENQNQVRFTLNNGVALVYDYLMSQWDVQTNIAALGGTIWQGNHTYLQAAGQVMTETPGAFVDSSSPVLVSLKTSWLSFAGIQGFQRVKRMLIIGQFKSAHALTVNLYFDFATTPGQTVNIPVSTDPAPYQFEIHIKQQKCQALQVEIIESQTVPYGEGMVLSNLAFNVGVKKGLNRLPVAKRFG